MREFLQRIRDWTRRTTLDAELQEELTFHRRMIERDAAVGGADASDARRTAARQLGNVTRVRESARQRWGIPWIEHGLRDVAYALRGLRRTPGFTITVVLTLALGLGANVAMFRVVDSLIFRPPAFLNDPGTVHRLYWTYSRPEGERTVGSIPYTRYLDVQRATSTFSDVAAYAQLMLPIGLGADTRELPVATVSASYFGFFTAVPALGRFFSDEEDMTPRGSDVVVLSYDYWQSDLGGRAVLGERLQIGNVRATVIGVAPRGFAGINDASPPAMWMPITTYAASTGTEYANDYWLAYRWGWVSMLARRKADVPLAQSTADATQAYIRSWDAAREVEPDRSTSAEGRPRVDLGGARSGAGPNGSPTTRIAMWVTLVALLVLLIATANVGNLFVARALRRQRETSVRLALGAGRVRLLLQSFIESGVLTGLSALTALLLAQWSGSVFTRLFSAGESVSVLSDARTLLFVGALALFVMVATGVLPMLLVRDTNLSAQMRGARGDARHGTRIRSALLLVQGALSTVLLIGAALFARSFDAVQALPLGYDTEQVLFAQREIRGDRPNDTVMRDLSRQLVAAANALPDVEAAAWASSIPFYATSAAPLFVTGIDDVATLGQFTYQVTTPEYFRTMGTRILQGRGLSPDDRLGAAPVAVVSESMSRVLWPGADAVGQCFRLGADTSPCVEVIGVAEDMVQRDLMAEVRYNFYLPFEQFTRSPGDYMLLKVRGDPVVLSETVRRMLQDVLPPSMYLTVQPLEALIVDEQRAWRLGATLFGVFGALAALVAAVGLHGVIGYNVTQRLHELGVRAALGATRAGIVRVVVAQSVRYIVAGVTVGLLLAVLASRWIEPLLFRQSAVDPVLYAGVAVFMLVVSLVASTLPAWRAAQVDPAVVLRAE